MRRVIETETWQGNTLCERQTKILNGLPEEIITRKFFRSPKQYLEQHIFWSKDKDTYYIYKDENGDRYTLKEVKD